MLIGQAARSGHPPLPVSTVPAAVALAASRRFAGTARRARLAKPFIKSGFVRKRYGVRFLVKGFPMKKMLVWAVCAALLVTTAWAAKIDQASLTNWA